MTLTAPDKLISVKELAHKLSCHPSTIWRLVKAERMPPPLKIGHLTRWSENDIDAFIENTKITFN